MRICIDARSPGYAGILNYSSCLLRSLLDIDKRNEYMILSAPRDKRWDLVGAEEKIVPSNNPLGWISWSNTTLPRIIESEKIDVYHSLKHPSAFCGTGKKVITFHSARLYVLPHQYKWYEFVYWRLTCPLAAKKYDRIIVVSEAEKRNYLEHTGAHENKFRVIKLAADKRFQLIKDTQRLQETKEAFGLPERFILFVGRLLPVKNIETIIRAYHLARIMKKIEHRLVIVGGKTWHYKNLVRLVKELDIQDDVVFTGYIFDELPCVYNLADLLLLPSHYEAFSAVPLEAMACGTPVITSDRGGLPEAVGDAGLLISPDNVGELADAITQVLLSDRLNGEMTRKGFERTGKFSWEHCAKETLKVYEELVHD